MTRQKCHGGLLKSGAKQLMHRCYSNIHPVLIQKVLMCLSSQSPYSAQDLKRPQSHSCPVSLLWFMIIPVLVHYQFLFCNYDVKYVSICIANCLTTEGAETRKITHRFLCLCYLYFVGVFTFIYFNNN